MPASWASSRKACPKRLGHWANGFRFPLEKAPSDRRVTTSPGVAKGGVRGGGESVGLLNVAGSQVAHDLEKHDFSTVLKVKTVLPPRRERRFKKPVFLCKSQEIFKNDTFQASPGQSF